MKKVLLILVFQTSLSVLSQSIESTYNSIGMGVGHNTPVEVWGVFYNQGFNIKSTMLELGGGIGLEEGVVLNGGIGIRFLKIYDKLEFFGEFDYSHHFTGTIEFEKNNVTDVYETGSMDYLHSSISFRYFIDYFLILQIRSGYSFLVSDANIQHKYGPNMNIENVNKRVGNGFLIGLELIIPF